MLRRLRIAVSVFFALVAVALCVLWSRSQSWIDVARYPWGNSKEFVLLSACGRLFISNGPSNVGFIGSGPVPKLFRASIRDSSQFDCRITPGYWRVQFPHWCPATLSAVVAAAFALDIFRRFSLRTMLIATTVIAVVLGLAMWASR